jgi:hypothetical protein
VKLKPGVKLAGLQPPIVVAMLVAEEVFAAFGVPLVVTSCNDGKHSAQSLHYNGRAFDARTKYPELDGRELELQAALREALGADFDVVLEAIGTDNEHAHLEFDPK